MFKIYGFDPTIYNCNPCNNAKRLLEARGIDYEFVSVAKGVNDKGKPIIDSVVADEVSKRTGKSPLGMTMPQIFDEEKNVYVGGFDELRQYI